MKFFTVILAIFLAGIVLVSVVPVKAQTACLNDSNCPSGYTCVGSLCRLPNQPVPPSQPKSCGQPCPAGATCIENPLTACSLTDLIDGIINFIFAIAVAITPIMVIVGGFFFVTAGGNPVRVTQGKQLLLWTAIGFTVILLAKGLVAVLRNVLGI